MCVFQCVSSLNRVFVSVCVCVCVRHISATETFGSLDGRSITSKLTKDGGGGFGFVLMLVLVFYWFWWCCWC